jgi:hypothetical protein
MGVSITEYLRAIEAVKLNREDVCMLLIGEGK